jgi:hypothetical protein
MEKKPNKGGNHSMGPPPLAAELWAPTKHQLSSDHQTAVKNILRTSTLKISSPICREQRKIQQVYNPIPNYFLSTFLLSFPWQQQTTPIHEHVPLDLDPLFPIHWTWRKKHTHTHTHNQRETYPSIQKLQLQIPCAIACLLSTHVRVCWPHAQIPTHPK